MARALSNPVYLSSPEKGVDGRTTLAGARAPLITDGRIGDFWIDTRTDEQRLYGPKSAAGWPDLGLIKGNRGWTPVFAAVTDGLRRVQRVVDWQGGEGTKPATGKYVGATGLVDAVADAIDIRGPEGPEMVIDGLTPAAAAITDDTQMPVAETGDDNEKRTVVEVFNLGTVLDRNSLAHAEASAVDPLIKCLRTQFRDPDYAERATLVGGASYVRVNAEPSHAGKFRSTDRFTAEGDSDSANGGWWELAERTVSPLMFGELGAGDDTEAVRACHEYANLYRAAVSYAGIAEISIQSDAQIPVNTDVDFGGCKINIVDGINPSTPSFSTFRVAFVAVDPDTPLVTGDAPITDGNLAEGSHTPTADFWTVPGFVYMHGNNIGGTSPVVSNRQGDGTLTYRQSFKVLKDGRTVYGLARSMTGAGGAYYRARRNSPHGWLTIKNFRLDASQFNNQIIIKANRNQVKVEKVNIDYDSVMPVSINQLFTVEDCSDFTLEGVTGPAQTSFSGNGTYIAALSNCAEITFDKCAAANGWGWQGSSNASGVYLMNSRVNRFDIHNGGFNFFADNCEFFEHGVTYGWGGGLFKVTNCRAFNCDLINSRVDYGGYWFGTMEVDGITADVTNSTTFTVVNMETNPVGVPILALPLPRAINIKNITRRGFSAATSQFIVPIRQRLATGAQPMNAPETITISDVKGAYGPAGWSMFNIIDLMNMVSSNRTLVSIDNVQATRALVTADLTALRTAVGMPAKQGVNTSTDLELVINNWSNAAVDLSAHDGTPRVTATGCKNIRRMRGKNGGRTIVKASEFDVPVLASGETTSPVGGTRTGTFGITSILSCLFTSTWDLSNAAMLAGNLWPGTQDANITLPAGATQATAMSGWRAGF